MTKYKLQTAGCGADYDPGYYYLQIYKFDENAGKWKEVWESSYFGGDELD